MVFGKVQGLSRYRKDVPLAAYCAAGLIAVMAEDCGRRSCARHLGRLDARPRAALACGEIRAPLEQGGRSDLLRDRARAREVGGCGQEAGLAGSATLARTPPRRSPLRRLSVPPDRSAGTPHLEPRFIYTHPGCDGSGLPAGSGTGGVRRRGPAVPGPSAGPSPVSGATASSLPWPRLREASRGPRWGAPGTPPRAPAA